MSTSIDEKFNLSLIRQNTNIVEAALINRQMPTSILDVVLKFDDGHHENDLALAAEEIPNIPAPDVPIGKDWTDNVVIKTVGNLPELGFKALDHMELGEYLDIIDIKRAEKISGPHFCLFKNEAAVLEMALMFYTFTKLIHKGFQGMLPPVMIKDETEWACGYESKKDIQDSNNYRLGDEKLVLVPSSEHAIIPIHSDEVIHKKHFPIKYVNYSQCFRREPNIYGQDIRGVLRVHNFNKVEMNVFSIPDYEISDKLCLGLLEIEEEIMGDLRLPYQIVMACTGDLPKPSRKMYDINTWFPGQNLYRETHSCSNCGEYQSRRLGIRVDDGINLRYVHTLNATAMTDRVLLAILENNQKIDKSICIPEVLWPYTGFSEIRRKIR